jgi:hypothetical protein
MISKQAVLTELFTFQVCFITPLPDLQGLDKIMETLQILYTVLYYGVGPL